MVKYYIRGEKSSDLGTIYFNFQKYKQPVRMRICTHIQIETKVWEVANKSIAAWKRFLSTTEGLRINDKLERMQEAVNNLYDEGKLFGENAKDVVDRVICDIVYEDAKRKTAERQKAHKTEETDEQKRILTFYDAFISGIKSGTIRHGNNTIYAKTTIANWVSFSKYLKGFCKPSDTFDVITKSYADRFAAYLEKSQVMPTTVNKYIICFRKLCNLAAEYGINGNATSLKVWKEREVKEEEKRAEVYLTDEELDATYTFPLEGVEEQARDLFILGCLTCQRYSDYGTLTRENFTTTINGTPIVRLRQLKTGTIVEIPILDSRINEICRKYDYDFPKLDARHINDHILEVMKKVAEVCPSLMEKCVTTMTTQERRKEEHFAELKKHKAAGAKLHKEDNRQLKKMSEYAKLHNGQPLYERNIHGQIVKFKYELVTTHTARRSGVTNLYKTGILDTREMMSISGHQTEKIFEQYIKMGKSEQADRIAAKYKKFMESKM